MVDRAVILAAGKGARLNGLGSDLPKCLVPLGGMSLIERQIRVLRAQGVGRIAIVVGHGAAQVREVCGRSIDYVENDRYSETNSLFSLWLARHLLTEGFVVLNADVLFHPQLLRDLLTARHEDALLVGYTDELATPLGCEEMKVRVRGGRIVDITKRMDPDVADGENVGIAKFGRAGARLLISKLEAIVESRGANEWAPRAFRDFSSERALHAIGTRGYPWLEIDFPEDYRRAVDLILPLIAGDDSDGRKPPNGSIASELPQSAESNRESAGYELVGARLAGGSGADNDQR